MPYIGNTPAEKYAAFNVQYFTTSATTSYTLDRAVANELDIRLVINNVIQEPGAGKAYTAAGTTLTLSAATAGSDTMYAVYIGKAVQTVNPGAGSVGTTALADNAVTLGKMASGTDGNIISYDASGNPVAVATGSSGQVLTSAGAGASPTFAAVPAPTSGIAASAIDSGTIATARLGSGTASSSTFLRGDQTYAIPADTAGLTLLATTNVTGTVASISMNGIFTSDYTNYFFVFRDVQGGINNQPIYLRFKDTSNNALSSSVYDYVNWGSDTNGATVVDPGLNQSAIQLCKNADFSGPTSGKASFFGTFYSPRSRSSSSGGAVVATMNWQSCYARSGILHTNTSSGTFDNSTACGGIQVYGGNGGGPSTYLDHGTFRVYGINGS